MNQLVKPGRKLTRHQLIFSVFITFISTTFIYFYWGLSHAQSAVAGGSVGIIPNFVFALYAFKYAGASASKRVMDSFFKGVRVKMFLTAFLFALCFKFLALSYISFFTTYILVVASPLLLAATYKFTFNQQ